jgi:putative transposase
MTEQNHCYENGIVEPINGILKDKFCLDQTFECTVQGKNALKLYNQVRLHLSLDYKTPEMVYRLTG